MPDLCCSHGSLARSCELCFRDGEIKDLRALLGEARRVLSDVVPDLPRGTECHGDKCRESECESCFGDFAVTKEGTVDLLSRIDSALATRAEKVPGASRAPCSRRVGEGLSSPTEGGLPPSTGTNPAEELAEALDRAYSELDGLSGGLRPLPYHGRGQVEVRAALAKYREGRKG